MPGLEKFEMGITRLSYSIIYTRYRERFVWRERCERGLSSRKVQKCF